jgi:hypothetical protein
MRCFAGSAGNIPNNTNIGTFPVTILTIANNEAQ